MGQTALGDVESRHDFQTGYQGILESQRWTHNFLEHTVNAETHPKHFLVGLDMNVAAAAFGGIRQDRVDQRDHRCIHGGLLQLLQIDVVVFLDDLHLAVTEFF